MSTQKRPSLLCLSALTILAISQATAMAAMPAINQSQVVSESSISSISAFWRVGFLVVGAGLCVVLLNLLALMVYHSVIRPWVQRYAAQQSAAEGGPLAGNAAARREALPDGNHGEINGNGQAGGQQ